MNQRERVLNLLKKIPGGIRTYEFFNLRPPILRPASRVNELRKLGWSIKTICIKRGVFQYKLERDNVNKNDL